MLEILKFVFSSFWIWLGTFLLLALVLQAILNMVNRIYRHKNINKHGYPPEHCDADGNTLKDCEKEKVD